MEDQNPNPPEELPADRPAESEAGPAEPHYPAEPRYAAPPPPPARRGPFERTPFLASILSIIPGLGNAYNGLYQRAFLIALTFFGLLATAINAKDGPVMGVVVPAMVFLWFFNLIDAYRQAVLINYGYTPERGLSETLGSGRGSGNLAFGAVIFVLGLFGLIQHINPRIDLSVLFDFWYLPFLFFGGWLFYRALKERRNRAGEEIAES